MERRRCSGGSEGEELRKEGRECVGGWSGEVKGRENAKKGVCRDRKERD